MSEVRRRFLILHGLGNRRPRLHWQWWLTDQLRSRGEQVLYPQLPDPDRPKLDAWLEVLTGDYAQLGDGERVVICHSLACALWYHACNGGALDHPADRVLLVAPPGPSVLARPADTASFSRGTCNAAAFRPWSRSPTRLVASDNDPECAEGPATALYGGRFGLDAETVAAAGHFSIADGYGPWPQLLRWCLDPTVRFSGVQEHLSRADPG